MYSFGNAPTYLAEYNLYYDPEAAYIALERIVPQAATNIVSNEFCLRNAFSPELIYDIDNSTTLGKFFADISTTEIERYENNKGSEETHEFEHPNGIALCDLYAPIILLYPETITSAESFAVTVELSGQYTRAMMVVDRTDRLLSQNQTAWLPTTSDMEMIFNLPSFNFDSATDSSTDSYSTHFCILIYVFILII